MIRFTVVWDKSIENQLARLWIDPVNRYAITRAADMIDSELRTDADQKGNPVGDSHRVLTVSPLEVLFKVSVDDRLVRITHLHFTTPNRYENN